MSTTLPDALKAIPSTLRVPLIQQFEELLSEYRSGRWEAVGLKAGKLCEIIYSIVSGHLNGSYPSVPSKPSNMLVACQQLEQKPNTFSRSLRIQIPRVLIAVYELRNNRAIGHVGGEVDPNHMDAEFFVRAAKWLISELVRIFAQMDSEAARDLIESVTERTLPIVWENDGTKRVLNPALETKDKILVLAYVEQENVTAKELGEWSGYTNLSRLRKKILKDLHKEALIHFDEKSDTVKILPTGIKYVESSGILKVS